MPRVASVRARPRTRPHTPRNARSCFRCSRLDGAPHETLTGKLCKAANLPGGGQRTGVQVFKSPLAIALKQGAKSQGSSTTVGQFKTSEEQEHKQSRPSPSALTLKPCRIAGSNAQQCTIQAHFSSSRGDTNHDPNCYRPLSHATCAGNALSLSAMSMRGPRLSFMRARSPAPLLLSSHS